MPRLYLRVFHSSSSSKQSLLLIQSKRIIHSIKSDHLDQTFNTHVCHVGNDVKKHVTSWHYLENLTLRMKVVSQTIPGVRHQQNRMAADWFDFDVLLEEQYLLYLPYLGVTSP